MMNNRNLISKNVASVTSPYILTVAILLPCSIAQAGAYEWGGLGSRAQSMGGAFTAIADDWTAIYWNPAGLTQLQGTGFGIDVLSPHPIIEDGSSVSNLMPANMETRYQIDTFAQYTGIEPTQFSDERVEYHFFTPTGLAGYWQHKGWHFGAGFYVPVGYYLDWDDTVGYGAGTITASLFQQLSIRTVNLSLARPISRSLAFGAGFNLLYGGIDYQANKVVANSGIIDYRWGQELDCDGVGYEGIFGLLYKASDKLNLGAVYRTGGTLNLEGEADTFLTLTSLNESSDLRQKFNYPATYGLGAAYKLKPDFTLAADWQRTAWSQFRIDIDYKVPGLLALQDRDYSADWQDSNRYRFGFEYRPTQTWSWRAGYMFDQSPVRDKSVSLTNVADVDRHNLTIGLGRQSKNNVRLDLMYGYAWGDRKVNGVSYHQRINVVGLSVSYRFK